MKNGFGLTVHSLANRNSRKRFSPWPLCLCGSTAEFALIRV